MNQFIFTNSKKQVFLTVHLHECFMIFKRVFLSLFFLNLSVLQAQNIKNADYLDLPVVKTVSSPEGIELNYCLVDGNTQRAMSGKEYLFYKSVIEGVTAAVDVAWINNQQWKHRDPWNYGTEIINGLYRGLNDDEKNAASKFSIKNNFLPGEKNPLFTFYNNQIDSLFKPKNPVTSPREYFWKIQNFENNNPRLSINIYINHSLNETSISGFKAPKQSLKIKTPYKVLARKDSIWYHMADPEDQNSDDLRFQRHSVFVILGNVQDIVFNKLSKDDLFFEQLNISAAKNNTKWARLDNITIELTGHPESVKLFMEKIDWKKIDSLFKLK